LKQKIEIKNQTIYSFTANVASTAIQTVYVAAGWSDQVIL